MLYTFNLWFAFQDFAKNWSLYLPAEEIIAVFSYVLLGALIESLLVIGGLLLLYALLPATLTHGRFVAHGTALTIAFLTAIMLRNGGYANTSAPLKTPGMVFAFFTVGTLVLTALAEKSQAARSMLESIAERCAIFLYIYLPISLLAVIVVLVRNLN